MERLVAAGWGVNRGSRAITEQQNLSVIEVVGAFLPSWQNGGGPERGAEVGGGKESETNKTGKQEKVERARADTSV